MSVTIAQITRKVLGKSADESLSMADTSAVGLPFMGGCYCCEATIHAGLMYPTKKGLVVCQACIEDESTFGFETTEEALEFMFQNYRGVYVVNAFEIMEQGFCIEYANKDIIIISEGDDSFRPKTQFRMADDDEAFMFGDKSFTVKYDKENKTWTCSEVSQEPELHADF